MSSSAINTAGSNLLAYLTHEIGQLQAECRRKHPEVREAAESTSQALAGILGRPDSIFEDLRSCQSLLTPFVLGTQTRSPKMMSISVTLLHRLIIHMAVGHIHIHQIFVILGEAVASGSEDIQLKALQCVMPLVTQFNFIHQAHLVKAYTIGLQLHGSHSPTIVNTAIAISRQLLIWLFEKVVEEDKLQVQEPADFSAIPEVEVKTYDNRTVTMPVFSGDAFIIFQDICLLMLATDDQQALVISNPLTINRSFGLELIESVISYHSQIFCKHPEFALVLREKVCTLAVRGFSDRVDFAYGCRLWRVIGILIHEFHEILVLEVEVFLSFVSKILDEDGPLWEKALVLEVLKDILAEPALLRSLVDESDKLAIQALTKKEHQLNVRPPPLTCLSNLLNGLINQILACLAVLEDPPLNSTKKTQTLSVETRTIVYSECDLRIPCLGQFEKASPPVIHPRYLLLLAYTSLYNWMKTLICESSIIARPLADSMKSFLVNNDIEKSAMLTDQYQFVAKDLDHLAPFIRTNSHLLTLYWSGLLKMHSVFLRANVDIEWRNMVILGLGNLVVCVATYRMDESLNTLLASLVDLALPEMIQPSVSSLSTSPKHRSSASFVGNSGSLVVSPINLDVSGLILHLGVCLDEVLGHSWCHPIRIIHGIDLFAVFKAKKIVSIESNLQNFKRGLTVTTTNTTNLTSTQPEMEKLAQLTELSRSLVEHSQHLSSKTFYYYLQALCQLSTETMLPESVSSGFPSSAKMTIVLFPIQKIKQVVLLNSHRFLVSDDEEASLTWEILMNQFIKVLDSPDPGLRGLGAEAFGLMMNQMVATIEPHIFQSSSAIQERIVEGLGRVLMQTRWPDIHKVSLDGLYRMLQGLGQYLNIGWSSVLSSLGLYVNHADPSSNFEEKGGETMLMNSRNTVSTILRPSFTCCKLICSDFLGSLATSTDSMVQLVALLAKFAKQTDDLNIALTAVGLFWDLSDYNQKNLKEKNECQNEYWLGILDHLAMLVHDARPELRNSAIQTLTRTIESHGEELSGKQWTSLFDSIIVPLLQSLPGSASSASILPTLEKINIAESLLHHSRDTQQKQWDETLVLMLQGIGQIFVGFFEQLVELSLDFIRWWDTFISLLEHYGKTSSSFELVAVSISCLTMLSSVRPKAPHSPDILVPVWNRLWNCWMQIGEAMRSLQSFTQDTLVAFVKILGSLHSFYQNHIGRLGISSNSQVASSLSISWIEEAFAVVSGALRCETPSDPVRDLDNITILQQTAIDLLESLVSAASKDPSLASSAASLHLRQSCLWLGWVEELRDIKMTRIPSLRRMRTRTNLNVAIVSTPNSSASSSPRIRPIDMGLGSDLPSPASRQTVMPCFVAMAISLIERVTNAFVDKKYHLLSKIFEPGEAFECLVKSLGRFMTIKYRAPSRTNGQAVWRVATFAFNKILLASLGDLSKDSLLDLSARENAWTVIGQVIERSMESNSVMVPRNLHLEQLEIDEETDLSQTILYCDKILPAIASIGGPLTVMRRILWALEASSRLYYCATSKDPKSTTDHQNVPQLSGTSAFEVSISEGAVLTGSNGARQHRPHVGLYNDTMPVIKEKLAVTCLKQLFKLSSALRSSNEAEVDPMKVLSRAALPILMDRCRRVIRSYVEDKKMLGAGKMPFPRVRQDEIVLILTSLLDLRVDGRVFIADTGLADSRRINERFSGTTMLAQDEKAGNTQEFTESLLNRDSYRRHLLGSPLGHLFVLYPEIMACAQLDDPLIMPLTGKAFSLIGEHLGLLESS